MADMVGAGGKGAVVNTREEISREVEEDFGMQKFVIVSKSMRFFR